MVLASELPDDVVAALLESLDDVSLLSASVVCTQWRSCAEDVFRARCIAMGVSEMVPGTASFKHTFVEVVTGNAFDETAAHRHSTVSEHGRLLRKFNGNAWSVAFFKRRTRVKLAIRRRAYVEFEVVSESRRQHMIGFGTLEEGHDSNQHLGYRMQGWGMYGTDWVVYQSRKAVAQPTRVPAGRYCRGTRVGVYVDAEKRAARWYVDGALVVALTDFQVNVNKGTGQPYDLYMGASLSNLDDAIRIVTRPVVPTEVRQLLIGQ